MSYEKKPRLTLFSNKFEGSPIKKKDGSFVLNSNGEKILQGAFNGKINLPEGLPAGDYDVSVYRATAKTGTEYLSGNIKKAYVKQEISEHSKAKGNGFVAQVNDTEEDTSDSIPW